MKKRPLSIVVIALLYLFEPVGNLLQAAYVNGLPLTGENSILYHLIWSDWIVLGLFPVVAYGIYNVKKWGWYLFLSFSVLLIFYNLYVYFYLNPNYHLQTVILFILIVTSITAIFFRKHVYSPYFNPRLRWWEVASRYRVALSAKIFTTDGPMDCQVLDISVTGCYVDYSGNLSEGDKIWLIIHGADEEIHCLGKIVRKTIRPDTTGYGIFFQTMSRDTQQNLKRMIRNLKALGFRDREISNRTTEFQKDLLDKKYTLLSQIGMIFKIDF